MQFFFLIFKAMFQQKLLIWVKNCAYIYIYILIHYFVFVNNRWHNKRLLAVLYFKKIYYSKNNTLNASRGMPGTSICFLFTVILLVKTWVICWLIKDTFVSRRLSTLAREANFYLLWWKKNNHLSWSIIFEWILKYQFVRYLKTYSLLQLHNYAIKPWCWFRLFHME